MTLDVPVAGMQGHANALECGLSLDALRLDVRALLPEPGRALSDDDNLIESGLDSLHVMRLVASLRRLGVAVTFQALIERPTLAAWWALVKPAMIAPVQREAPEPEPGDAAASFPLTDVQHAYWIGRRDDQPLGGTGCHAYMELDGRGVEPSRLEAAWRLLVRHHGMLRAVFDEDGAQRIDADAVSPMITVHDLRQAGPDRLAEALDGIRGRLSHRRLRIEKGEVAGLELTLLPDGTTRIHFDLDLLVADVQSLQVILRDLAAAYARGAAPPAASNWSFARILAQEEKRKAATRDADRAYWHTRLADVAGGPALPLARSPEEVRQPRFHRRIHRLTPPAWSELRRLSASHQVTPATVLATAYAETLARWSASPRFLLNLPLFDRPTAIPGIEEVVADFTNLLLFAVDCSPETPFAGRVRALQTRLHADMAHAGYSGVRVQRDLARLRSGERTFAPVVFACNLGSPLLGAECRSVLGDLTYMISQTPQVWLDHQVYELDGGLLLTWDSVDDLFPAGLLDAMFAAYGRLVDTLAEEAASWDRPVPALLPRQQQLAREAANATAMPRIGRTLHQAVFDRALSHPGRPALFDGDAVVSYGELRRRALQVAAALTAMGVIEGSPVAVSLARGADQIVAVFGILAAGGCYVPVGLSQPEARRERIFGTAGIRHVITAGFMNRCRHAEPLEHPVSVSPASSAYVIFTSGSTGDPKGVEIAHHSACNTIDDVNRRYGIGSGDRVLAVSALDFDLSVYDIFGLLGAGGAVVLVDEEERRDAAAWLRLIRRHGVTVWNSVPVLLDMLLVAAGGEGEPLPLRLALASGDWVGLDLPGRLSAATGGGCRMVALGGATEASIWSNACEVTGPLPPHWTSIPYGFPLANQCYRVVDALGRDCPDWVPGELWIGGAGVATGYRGDPELTAQRFVGHGGERWYRTGDRGRYWPDGTLEFLGRVDHQVKVRGHRIELGEIEAALNAQPGVRQAVAVAVGRPLALAAALVPEPGAPADIAGRARAGLAGRVPDYMIPAVLAVVETLPLSINGKIDRKAVLRLLENANRSSQQTYEEPQGELERQIADLWSDVLECGQVSRHDDFFQLGGDSLRATRFFERLRSLGLSPQALPLRLLFSAPTVAALAEQIRMRMTEGDVEHAFEEGTL